MVRYSSIRFLIALAVKLNLHISQMDAITAFLQGELSEEIYMRQPESFSDGTEKVCRLNKSLYGLKQSSRVWNEKLSRVLKKLGLNQSTADQCIFSSCSEGKILIVAIYVDDILIFDNDDKARENLKCKLQEHFKMKDIGEATSVLGVRIARSADGSIALDQSYYIEKILKRFNMIECKPISTPMDANEKLSSEMCPKTAEERDELKDVPYQELIGSLMFAAQITRPDICFAVSKLSQFNMNFGKQHWQAAKRVLRYLRGTIDKKLCYHKSKTSELVGYCDSDWAGDIDQRRSTTGYVFTMCDGAVSWATKQQKTVALSTTEAEYMAMVAAIQESIWLQRLKAKFSTKKRRRLFYFATIVALFNWQKMVAITREQNIWT